MGISEYQLPNESGEKLKRLIMADHSNIEDIVALRIAMQLEDWNKTSEVDLLELSENYSRLTKKHLNENLNKSLHFALMYIGDEAVAMCAIEALSQLPQITACFSQSNKQCNLVSVYTKPVYRGRGYQQQLLKYLLDFAKTKGFNNVTLITNTPDAAHIYEKFGFKLVSNKYFLNF